MYNDQDYLEKDYSWNSEDDGVHVAHGYSLRTGTRRPNTRKSRPNKLHVGIKETVRVTPKLSIGWNGIKSYIKQCKESENRK